MTTNIKITTNGNYVSEGHLTIWGGSSADGTTEIKVGPGSMKEHNIGVPHGSGVRLELTERPATPDEIEAAKPKTEAA